MGVYMCFIIVGMGGGIGMGVVLIIVQVVCEMGILIVGVVMKFFQFEGIKWMCQVVEGVEVLQKVVDMLIIIFNQNLFWLVNEKIIFIEVFVMVDDVLYQGVKGVIDLMVCLGLINFDFVDVCVVMDEMGKVMMGMGEVLGENCVVQVVEKVIVNLFLDEISLNGVCGVLINIIGGYDLILFEMDEVVEKICEKVDFEVNIIVGLMLDLLMEGLICVLVVVIGIDVLVVELFVLCCGMKDLLIQMLFIV